MRPLDSTQLAWSSPRVLPDIDNSDSNNPSIPSSSDTVGFSGGSFGKPAQSNLAPLPWVARFKNFIGLKSANQTQNLRSVASFGRKEKKNWKIWTGLAATLTGIIGLGIAAHHWNWGGFRNLL